MENISSWATLAGLVPLAGLTGLLHKLKAPQKLASATWTYETIRVESKDGLKDCGLLIGPDGRIWAVLTAHGAEQFALEPGEQITATVPSRVEKAAEKPKEPPAPPSTSPTDHPPKGKKAPRKGT